MKDLNHKDYRIPGIYLITCLSNGKTYIGSSKCIYHRVKRHLSELRRNTHANPILQNCFNKYGEDDFKTTILEIVHLIDNENILIEREKYWVDSLKSVMNIRDPVKLVFTENQKQRISNTLKEYFKENPQQGKKLTIFDLQGNLLGHFDRWRSAGEFCKTLSSSLRKVLDKSLQHKGFLVRSGHISQNPIPYKKGKKKNLTPIFKIPVSLKEEWENTKIGKILQFDKNGFLLNIFNNPTDASNKTDTKLEKIYLSTLNGYRGGDYYWRQLSKIDFTQNKYQIYD